MSALAGTGVLFTKQTSDTKRSIIHARMEFEYEIPRLHALEMHLPIALPNVPFEGKAEHHTVPLAART